MPLYAYKAIDSKNKVTQATASAASKDEVATELEKKGLTPVSIKALGSQTQSKKTIPIIEKITFCRYVSTMLKSGLSITESMNVLSEEATHPTTKKVLNDLNYGIQHGQNLSSIMVNYPNIFDNFFITIVKSGEVSGTLGQAFSQIEAELRAEHSLKQKIGGALLYPAVVFTAMIAIGLLMFFYVLPQIGQVFLNLKLPLAAPTRILFEVTLYLNQFKFLLIAGGVTIVVTLIIFFQTKFGKRLFMNVFTAIPIVKNLIKQIDIARFCRVFSTLLASGVPITQALEISLSSLSYAKFRDSAKPIVEEVTKGQTVAIAFKNHKIFPALLTQMIASGEKSGTLDETLGDLGEFYAEEVENSVKKTTELMEPILMLIVGIGVGVMVLSVITPIYSVVNNIQAAR